MIAGVISVRPDATIEQAITIMLDRRISAMPVADVAGRLVGTVMRAISTAGCSSLRASTRIAAGPKSGSAPAASQSCST